jgi:gamma-glutamyl-gamma-aminobutyrate hydrolase PuuD
MIINPPVVIVLLFTICFAARAPLPQTPVIGVYTQDAPNSAGLKHTYIAASYIKYLEMSGAQVVPIFYNSTQAQLNDTLNQINGVLFTGGDQAININNLWTKNAEFIL